MIDTTKRTMDWIDYQNAYRSIRLPTPPTSSRYRPKTIKDSSNGAGCPTCGMLANGWLRSEFPVGHIYFGFLVRCPDCINESNLIDKLRRHSQLTGWLETASFEKFRRANGNAKALDACREMGTLSRRGWLTLIGSYGCGKTHLLAATVNYAISNKIPAVYYTLADLLALLRTKTNENGADVEDLFTDISQAQVLALDEFDTDKFKLTEWAGEQVYRILDDRYRNVATRSTLIAMQYQPIVTTDQKLGYVYSRMRDSRCQIIEITSGSYREII